MRRIALAAPILLGCVATPVLGLDLGRWLPSVDLPAWPRVEAPAPAFTPDPVAPAPAETGTGAAAPGGVADGAEPPEPRELDPTTAPVLDANGREPRRARPRGWRGLLPGSLK